MPRIVQFIRGTTAQNEVFNGLVGELTVDTDKQTLVLHDGAGGISPMVTEDNAQVVENKTLALADNTFTGIDGDGLEIVSNILGVDDTVVRTVDPQSIAGNKTFTDTVTVSGIDTNATTVPLLIQRLRQLILASMPQISRLPQILARRRSIIISLLRVTLLLPVHLP